MEDLFYKCLTLKGIIREASRRAEGLADAVIASEENEITRSAVCEIERDLERALHALGEIEKQKNGDRNSI